MSFDHPFTNFAPRVFPGDTFASIVAPFWGDVDIRRDGDIFYHVYDDPSSPFIERAATELSDFLRSDFRPTWILVVTWVDVPNYPDGSFYFRSSEIIRVSRGIVYAMYFNGTFALSSAIPFKSSLPQTNSTRTVSSIILLAV